MKTTVLSGQLKSLSLTPGAVFLGPFEGIDHEKFMVIAGIDDKKSLCLHSNDQLKYQSIHHEETTHARLSGSSQVGAV